MAETLRGIIEGAKETLIDITDGGENAIRKGTPTDDHITEAADGAVPVYHSQLLELAAGNNNLATDEPDIGPAFVGTPTPVNIIAANIYEAVQEALHEYVQELAGEPLQCTVKDCGEDDDHLDTDNETCIEHCDNEECDECPAPEED